MDLFEKIVTPMIVRRYNAFYDSLARLSKKSYRYEVKKTLLKKSDSLTKQQKKEIKDYWKKYTNDFDISFHKYYINRHGKYDVKFIPDDLFAGYIDRYLNNREIECGIADKNYFDMYLAGFKMPKTYLHLINGQLLNDKYELIDKNEAVNILLKYDSFIVKPSTASYGGKNVELINNYTREYLYKYLENTKDKNLIFQEVIKQNNEMSILHPKSVNTIRAMTLLLDGDIKVLNASLRIGVGDNRVDNASAGGIYCGINSDGTLTDFAYNSKGERFDKHPDGMEFNCCKISIMEDVNNLIRQAAQRFPNFRLIGWDIAINEKCEPVIIEANLTMSSLDVVQTVNGPLFGEYTERVLEEIFNSDKKKNDTISLDVSQYI